MNNVNSDHNINFICLTRMHQLILSKFWCKSMQRTDDDKTEQTIDIYMSDTIYRRELVIIIGFLSDNSECLVTECVINL